MRDALAWSFPLGRLFGINIRVHWLFPVVAAGLVLRAGYYLPGTAWQDVLWLQVILFVSVLLHEFGHCFAARYVEGDAKEILMWPLGGLAFVEVPHTPRANLITALGGPAVNIVLCFVTALLLILVLDPGYYPPWDLFNPPIGPSHIWLRPLAGGDPGVDGTSATLVLLTARVFWVNLFLAAFNLLLIGYPMDSGRIFQCVLWPWVGYRRATLASIFAGFIVMLIIGIVSIWINEVLLLALAAFIYFSCKNQWILLETGGDESLLGYDFSQGYTSLERDEPDPAPRRNKLSWFQRWKQRRAARRLQRDQEQRQAEEERMDALLQKVQSQGMDALTEEEKRFLKRVSDRYKNRR